MWRDKLPIVIVSIAIAAVLVFLLGRQKADKGASKADAYSGLRSQALATTQAMLGNVQGKGVHGVYGVLMEMRYPAAAVTLATYVTGDASLYFSNGGGMLGGIGIEAVNKAAVKFSGEADAFIPQCKKTDVYPLPASGQAVFYILTKEGIYTAQASEDDLGNKRHPLFPLFYAGQNVITQFRLAEEKRKGKRT